MEFFAVVMMIVLCGTVIGVKNGKKEAARQMQNMKFRKKASAVPNQPRKSKKTVKQRRPEEQVCASGPACGYEAAYSKGRPERIGQRGDYDPVTPEGWVRVCCRFCGAENFVPQNAKDHYHCYFCWEKL